jgi:hypothetical protein
MASSSGIFLWLTDPGTGESFEKNAEEATSMLLAGELGPDFPARLAGDERVSTVAPLFAWLDLVHASRLELSGAVNAETIRTTYRKLSRQYHPDHTETLGPDLQALAEMRFKEIGESKSYLLGRIGAGMDTLVINADAAEPKIPPPPPSLTRAAVGPLQHSAADSTEDLRASRRSRQSNRAGTNLTGRVLGPVAILIGLGAALLWLGDRPDREGGGEHDRVTGGIAVNTSATPLPSEPIRVVEYSDLVRANEEKSRPKEKGGDVDDNAEASEETPPSPENEGAPASPARVGDPESPDPLPPASAEDPAPPSKPQGGTGLDPDGISPPPITADPDNPAPEEGVPGTVDDPAVAGILAEYERAAQLAAGDEFDRKLGMLNEQYKTALKSAQTEAVSKGQLEVLVAIRGEERAVDASGKPEADPRDLPDSIAALRTTYMLEREKLEEARERDLTGPRAAALSQLEERVKSATREGLVDLAIAIRSLIADFARDAPVIAPATPAPAAEETARRPHPGFKMVATGLKDQRMTRAISVFDFNRDDLPDLLCFGNGVRGSSLYESAGWPRFTKAPAVGEDSVLNLSQRRGAGWARIGATGGIDFFAAGGGVSPVLLRGDSLGKFSNQTSASGLAAAGATRMACWGDVNGDGHIDLAIVSSAENTGDIVSLWLNSGNSTFSKKELTTGLIPPGTIDNIRFVDTDLDGDLDLLVVGLAGFQLLENDGTGIFRNTTRDRGLSGITGSVGEWGDPDNDGRLDVLFPGGSGSRARFFIQDSGGLFREDSWRPEGEPMDVAWLDIDADGFLDLFVAGWNGQPSRVYLNLGSGAFGTAEPLAGLAYLASAYGVAVADLDRDGAEDLVLSDWGSNAVILENLLNPARNSFLRIRPAARRDAPNGHGAVVRLLREPDGALVGLRLVDAGSGTVQSPGEVLFHGLTGSYTVEITFPGGGTVRKTGLVPDGKTLEITP